MSQWTIGDESAFWSLSAFFEYSNRRGLLQRITTKNNDSVHIQVPEWISEGFIRLAPERKKHEISVFFRGFLSPLGHHRVPWREDAWMLHLAGKNKKPLITGIIDEWENEKDSFHTLETLVHIHAHSLLVDAAADWTIKVMPNND
jgi:hypothetical protein